MSDIGGIIRELAAELLPGWQVSWEMCAASDIGGALAMVYPTPSRQLAHIKVAPHPPGESPRESIAHEIVHAVISPLTQLLDNSPASVMLEEPIAERLGNWIAKHMGEPGLLRAMRKALAKPRTSSPIARARISALASGRLGKGKKRMLSAEQLTKALEALESGDPEATKAILKELIATMATGGGSDEPPQSQNEPHVIGRDPAEDDMNGGQYRDDEQNGNGGGQMRGQRGRGAPQTALDKTLARARQAEQKANAAARGAAQITIRARVKELRGEGVSIDDATAQKLVALGDVDAAEERIGYMLQGRNATQRGRSGVIPDDDKSNGSNALRYEDLIKEKIPEQQARELVELSKRNRVAADAELQGARIRLRSVAAGGA